jgi:geranylgeranyl diphosphate synthase, type I
VQTDAGGRPAPAVEQVVLLDADGRPTGTATKLAAHHADTPYHLAFSAHVVDRDGRVLVTRRALAKPTWPGTWTNACCGHPGPGESLRAAVTRRLAQELGLRPRRMAVALPDFAYRATMADGTVEHELCPVVVAEIDGEPALNPDEVADHGWLSWAEFLGRARRRPASLSPWAVAQAAGLAGVVDDPLAWLDRHARPAPPGPPTTSPIAVGLDVGLVVPPTAAGPAGVAGPGARSQRPPDPLAPVGGPFERLLHDTLAAGERELVALDPALAQVTGEIRGLVAAGGKRLRPAFVYWGHRASGAPHDERVLAVAAAVELLHTFALLHDDVMDRSPIRRGRPSAHRALGDVHDATGLVGDAAWFGLSAAVLAGDLAFVWADGMLDRAGLDADAEARARRVFTTLRVEVMAGQYLDLRLADDPAAHEADAERVALLKSGRYTVTRPL